MVAVEDYAPSNPLLWEVVDSKAHSDVLVSAATLEVAKCSGPKPDGLPLTLRGVVSIFFNNK